MILLAVCAVFVLVAVVARFLLQKATYFWLFAVILACALLAATLYPELSSFLRPWMPQGADMLAYACLVGFQLGLTDAIVKTLLDRWRGRK
ncbi:hypothetical protein CEK28_14470 [Xenophilus sp. AP218F]|nr:hypothetical protein [Chromobacterium sp. ASV5]OWY38122.1 hypothetical protein CEK28_14470 [Xenophilus sp. AP218F]